MRRSCATGRCEWCLYWRRNERPYSVMASRAQPETKGECRKTTPVVFIDELASTGLLTTHPQTSEDHWCGEFTEGPNCPAEEPKGTTE